MIQRQQKFHVKKGDLVYVITGDFKGLQGLITKVKRKVSKVTVEGLPKVKKSIRPSQTQPEGGYKELDRYIHISNVKKVTDVPATKPDSAKKKATKKAAKKK